MTTEPNDLLASFDRHERRGPALPPVRVERTARTIRHLEPDGGAWIVWSDLAGAPDPDAVIAAERDRFARLGRAVEWKTYAHDRPSDLGARLRAAGFVPEEPEALLLAPAHVVVAATVATDTAPGVRGSRPW